MTYKLTYYDCQGRGELIWLIFHAAGVNFFDERVKEAPKDKPFDLPYLSIHANLELPKSRTIARYVARQLNLAGEGDLEQSKTDAVVDTCAELLELQISRAATAAANTKIEDDNELKEHLTRLEKVLRLFGSEQFSVGSNLTWADLAVFDATSHLEPNLLTSFERITSVRKNVAENARISGYLKYRPTSPFIIPEAF